MKDMIKENSEATLMEHQQVLMELLVEFDRICKKHNIRYQLFAGSALGAVRHGEIIPWDDDLDVVMLRSEYRRFLEIAPTETDTERFFLQSEYSEHWPMFFSKLRKNNTACIERYIPKDPKTHSGVYIDIFPCDNLADGKLSAGLQFMLSKAVIAKGLYRRGYAAGSSLKKLFMLLCRFTPVRLFNRWVMREHDNASAQVHTFFGASSCYEKGVYPREWFTESILLPFGEGRYPVSKHFDALLTKLYGDYMTPLPESKRGCKVHAVQVDLENSYEKYWQMRQNIKIEEYTRSIR